MTARDLFTEDTNTHREGHGVLKGEKPTPSASTERPDPTFSRARICCGDCGRGTVNALGFVRTGFEQPPTPQGWGGPLQRAARTGLLIKVGSVPDPNPARHGSDVPLWEVA